MADVNGLRVPGIEDAAYQKVPGFTRGPAGEWVPTTNRAFDPAAAERYTSAYEFGWEWLGPSGGFPGGSGWRDDVAAGASATSPVMRLLRLAGSGRLDAGDEPQSLDRRPKGRQR